jgi:hypothetical protein
MEKIPSGAERLPETLIEPLSIEEARALLDGKSLPPRINGLSLPAPNLFEAESGDRDEESPNHLS